MTDRLRFGCVIGLLLVTTLDLRWLPRAKAERSPVSLAAIPMQFADWSGRNLPRLTAKEESALAADSYLLREYDRNVADVSVVLFVAYYASQRSGDAIHSPKNCLPGAGWVPVSSEVVQLGESTKGASSFSANHYVIEKNGVQQDVLYWYQAGPRKFASEYLGKIYLAWDAATQGRTDGALIRITTTRRVESKKSLESLVSFERMVEPALSESLRD